MKAVVKMGYGPDLLAYMDYPKPAIGRDEVLIKVKAAGICGSDLNLMYGTVTDKTVDYPIVIGHEFAGEICGVGADVTRWKEGDRVVSDNTGYVCGICHACATGDYLNCASRKGMGNDMDGGFAEYVRIPGQVLKTFPNCLYRIPEGCSYEAASILDPCCNGYKAVVQEAGFKPGETIVVFGAGALGLFCVHMANIVGADRIILVGTSEDVGERFVQAGKLGATDFVVSDREDVCGRIRELCAGREISAVIDCAGVPVVLEQAMEIVRNGGTIVKIGFSPRPLGYSLDRLVSKAITLKGHMGYDSTSWMNCLKLLEQGKIHMEHVISSVIPMSEWKVGFEKVKNKEATKIILVPGK